MCSHISPPTGHPFYSRGTGKFGLPQKERGMHIVCYVEQEEGTSERKGRRSRIPTAIAGSRKS